MIQDPVAVFVVLAAIVTLALWLEERVRPFRSLGAALVAILCGMALSNTGVLPGDSAAYDFLMDSGVSLGIVLILLGIDARSLRQAGPRMLAAFGLGALGTIIGATLGALLLSSHVGPETWKLAGQFTGTYIGGGMNFAALGQALDTSGSMFTAAIAADVIVTAAWMAACLAVPALFSAAPQATSAARAADADAPLTLDRALYETGRSVPLRDAAAVVALATASVWLSRRLGAYIPAVPAVLWLTSLALVAAQVPAVRRLAGSAVWGNYIVLLFLAGIGAQSVVARIFQVGPAVFYFAILTVGVHGAVIFGVGRLLGIDWGTLAVASQANVGGPASAMAIAGARGYADRVLPGIAVGLLGYAAGNYAGFAVASAMRALL